MVLSLDPKEMIQMPDPGKVLKAEYKVLPRKALTTLQTAALKSRPKVKVMTPTSTPDEMTSEYQVKL